MRDGPGRRPPGGLSTDYHQRIGLVAARRGVSPAMAGREMISRRPLKLNPKYRFYARARHVRGDRL